MYGQDKEYKKYTQFGEEISSRKSAWKNEKKKNGE